MRGRPKVSGVTVAVLLSMLTAIGVALATRSAAPAEAGADTPAARAQTATPQALSMGGAVPAVSPTATPTWVVRDRQSRVSNLASVFFVDDRVGFAGGYGALLATHDGGRSWTTASIPDVGGAVAAFACARSPQFGQAPPPSEPDFTNVPPQILGQVKAGVRHVNVGAASGWFHQYYSVKASERSSTQLDLYVGQYNLLIYADTTLWGDHYQSVEGAASAASDFAAAAKIAATVIARLPAVPPPPT